MALLGANGTGKTTLLRILCTLLRPTGGSVSVLGQQLPDGEDIVRQRVSLMTAGGHTYEELTGAENLRFASRMCGIAPDPDTLDRALAEVRLDGFAHTPVRAYSTGMRKRLELARLRLRPLDLVLLDEPFVSLDEEGVELTQTAVAAWRDEGATVVIASHRVAEATRHADRTLRMEAGKIAEDAS